MRGLPFETWTRLSGTLYVGLATNVALTVVLAPLLVLLVVVPDLTTGWPLPVLLAGALGAPALTAAAATSGAHAATGSTAALRTFAAAWRRSLRRAVPLGLGTGAVLVVVGADAVVLAGTVVGALSLPLLGVVGALAVAVTVLAGVALAERPDARLRDVVRPAVWLGVRRWPSTLLSLAVLALLVAAVLTRPALGLGLAASPLLHVVWTDSRWALRAVLGEMPAGEHRPT